LGASSRGTVILPSAFLADPDFRKRSSFFLFPFPLLPPQFVVAFAQGLVAKPRASRRDSQNNLDVIASTLLLTPFARPPRAQAGKRRALYIPRGSSRVSTSAAGKPRFPFRSCHYSPYLLLKPNRFVVSIARVLLISGLVHLRTSHPLSLRALERDPSLSLARAHSFPSPPTMEGPVWPPSDCHECVFLALSVDPSFVPPVLLLSLRDTH